MSDTEEPSVSTPLLVSAACLVVALIVPCLRGGFGRGSLIGAAIAFAGAVPAAYAAWKGLQSKATQSRFLVGLMLLLACTILGVLLLVLRAIRWLHG
jgi:hypothetical protein